MINSVSGYMSGPTNRMTGLVSGMDIDSIVDSLTMSTQTKIAGKNSDKQILSWQTEAYRSISSKLNKFSDKYFSYSSPTNLLSQNFFQSSSPAVFGEDFEDLITVSGDTSTASKVIIEEILQIASSANLKGSKDVVSDKIGSDTIVVADKDKTINNLAGKTIEFHLPDGDPDEPIEIKFDDDFGFNADGTQMDDSELADKIVTEINSQIQELAADNPDLEGFTIAKKEILDSDDVGTGDFQFVMRNETGEKLSISGDALSTLGIKSGSIGSGNDHKSTKIIEKNFTTKLSLKDSSMTLNYNGLSKKITLDGDYASNADLLLDLQTKIDDAFGSNKIKVSSNYDGKFSMKTGSTASDGTFTPSATETLSVDIADKAISEIIGFEEGQYNRINMDKNLDELNFTEDVPTDPPTVPPTTNTVPATLTGNQISVNGVIISFDPTKDTMSDLIKSINASDADVTVSYSSLTNKFSATSNETGSQTKIDIKDVNDGNIAKLTGLSTEGLAAANKIVGTDTKIKIDYNGESLELTSSSASITFDGLTIGVTEEAIAKQKELKDEGKTSTIKFKTDLNTDEVVETMTEFVKDYNEILDLVNSEYSVSKSGDETDYLPLTAEQKAEMTETQIKDWEKIAKKGLLYGSSELRSLSTDLRSAVTGLLSGNELANFIGLETSKEYSSNGKIEFNEEIFKKALTDDPAKVSEMFTKSFNESLDESSSAHHKSGGIMYRLEAVVDKYASTSGPRDDKGILIRKAGADNSLTSEDNVIYDSIILIDEQLASLERTLASEKSYHYGKFSALEVYLQQMNAQSAWLYEEA